MKHRSRLMVAFVLGLVAFVSVASAKTSEPHHQPLEATEGATSFRLSVGTRTIGNLRKSTLPALIRQKRLGPGEVTFSGGEFDEAYLEEWMAQTKKNPEKAAKALTVVFKDERGERRKAILAGAVPKAYAAKKGGPPYLTIKMEMVKISSVSLD